MTRIEQHQGSILLYPPAKDYLYPETRETCKRLLLAGHLVIVWSNEYLKTIGSAELGIGLRSELPYEDRHRFSVAAATVYEDKFELLPQLIEKGRNNSVETILVVDNSLLNLQTAADILFGEDKISQFQLVHINRKVSVPTSEPFSLYPNIPLHTISDLSGLLPLADAGKKLFAIDFNETMVDSQKWKSGITMLE